MPTEEEAYHPGTIVWRNGRATSPLDKLRGLDKFYEEEKHIRRKYSTRVIKRKQQAARDRFFAEPTSFTEARERGLNYYWDSGE